MDELKYRDILSVMGDYDAFLFDLWGVIVEGENIYEGVIETINAIIASGKSCCFVSNAPRPVESSFYRIQSWGVEVDGDCVFTSGEIARQIIIAENYCKVYHLGRDRNKDILQGLTHLETRAIEQAEAALLTLYRDEGEDLEEFNSILVDIARQNIPIICANPDITIPLDGKIRYCSGYFAQNLERLGCQVIQTGKPHPQIYNQVLARLKGVPLDRILMIGDTLETDILGASRAGIHSALVLTGNSERLHRPVTSMEQKLELLTRAAEQKGMMPNFVVGLGKV